MSAADSPASPVRFRSRAFVLLGVGAALAAVAVADRDSVPLFLAVPLLLGPVAALLAAARAAAPRRVVWSVDGSRDEVEVVGSIEAAGAGPPTGIVPVFARPEPLVERVPPEVEATASGIEFRLHWSAPYPCLVTVECPTLVWRDPLGLLERNLPVLGEPLRVQRFPPELARAARAPLRRTTPLPGEVRARQLGPSGEFFGLRPYGEGDTARQVNWSATARSGRMLANDFRVERTGDLLIVLDLRPTSLGPEIDARLASVACAGAYGLAESFLDQKARVGLALFSEFVTAIPLGSGRRQRYQLLRALQAARIGDVAGPSERLAVSLRRYFPPGVTTVVVSPLADDDSTMVLPHLRRRGFPSFVLSPSPIRLLTEHPGPPTEDDARAVRLLQLVRRRRVADAWSEAPVVEWDDFWSLTALTSFFARPAGRRSGP
ncbi:MAG: DUF58 domain-containing protein [Thermoplasmata archaeon]|nr:DUF58 domain-containing protein [Thermoplasmata archaeon]